jgi:hypothetical protein
LAGWIPRTLREFLDPYFDRPSSVPLDVSDPDEIELEDDAARKKIAARSLRMLLSAAQGMHDLEYYLTSPFF